MNEIPIGGVVVDWTITLGNILQLVGFTVGAIIFVIAMRGDVRMLSLRVSTIETVLKSIGDLLPTLARQDERLNSHTQRILELERDRHDRDRE